VRVFDNGACEFRYRETIFKGHKEWTIFSTELRLDAADADTRYARPRMRS
jgi:UDP-N-acetylenolpyruvoylglucosamine reductase